MKSHGLGAIFSPPRDPGHGVMDQISPSLAGVRINQIMLETRQIVLQPIGGLPGSGMIWTVHVKIVSNTSYVK